MVVGIGEKNSKSVRVGVTPLQLLAGHQLACQLERYTISSSNLAVQMILRHLPVSGV